MRHCRWLPQHVIYNIQEAEGLSACDMEARTGKNSEILQK